MTLNPPSTLPVFGSASHPTSTHPSPPPAEVCTQQHRLGVRVVGTAAHHVAIQDAVEARILYSRSLSPYSVFFVWTMRSSIPLAPCKPQTTALTSFEVPRHRSADSCMRRCAASEPSCNARPGEQTTRLSLKQSGFAECAILRRGAMRRI